MEAPSLKICRTPRLLQRYLAKLARNLPGKLPETDVVFNVDDAVLVLVEGVKYPGKITKVFGKGPNAGLYDVTFEDSEEGRYSAEDFC